jgi:hypothetical protein
VRLISLFGRRRLLGQALSGTSGSNPPCSSGESANPRSLARDPPSGGGPSTVDLEPIRRRPARTRAISISAPEQIPARAIRPVFHQLEARVEAHVFIAFLAYCLHITLMRRLHALAPGLTPRSVLEKFAAVQMIDVHLPTTDGRELLLTRYTEPEPELRLLQTKLKLDLPAQPPPKITAAPAPPTPL